MSATVEPVRHEIPKGIQTAIAEMRAEMRAGFEEIRVQTLKEPRNSAGTRVMMRATAGDFDARVQSLESRGAAREATA